MTKVTNENRSSVLENILAEAKERRTKIIYCAFCGDATLNATLVNAAGEYACEYCKEDYFSKGEF